jgi:hypothetical protein
MWNGFAGALMAHTPPNQHQAILPSTIDVYNSWVASHGASRSVDVLAADDSIHLLWIGQRESKKVILFFHVTMSPFTPLCFPISAKDRKGGGYVMPLFKGHLDWMAYIRTEAANAEVQLSVCILEYGQCS